MRAFAANNTSSISRCCFFFSVYLPNRAMQSRIKAIENCVSLRGLTQSAHCSLLTVYNNCIAHSVFFFSPSKCTNAFHFIWKRSFFLFNLRILFDFHVLVQTFASTITRFLSFHSLALPCLALPCFTLFCFVLCILRKAAVCNCAFTIQVKCNALK